MDYLLLYNDPLQYQASHNEAFKGRTDHESDRSHFRWHQVIQSIDLSIHEIVPPVHAGIAIIGYAVDEGVKRNNGRPGAALGPDIIRKKLGLLPVHHNEGWEILDCGNIYCKDENQEESQELLATTTFHLLQKQWLPVILGGGHDLSYGSHKGLSRFAKERSCGIVNFDAHFDLRTPDPLPNSGTPFYQLMKENLKHYCVIGIQKNANTSLLFNTANAFGVRYFTNDKIYDNRHQIYEEIDHFIENIAFLHLSIDLDFYSSSIAPGVSAPSPFGPDFQTSWPLIHKVFQSTKLKVLDIAEYNPSYDKDNMTAQLAAGLVFRYLQTLCEFNNHFEK